MVRYFVLDFLCQGCRILDQVTQDLILIGSRRNPVQEIKPCADGLESKVLSKKKNL